MRRPRHTGCSCRRGSGRSRPAAVRQDSRRAAVPPKASRPDAEAGEGPPAAESASADPLRAVHHDRPCPSDQRREESAAVPRPRRPGPPPAWESGLPVPGSATPPAARDWIPRFPGLQRVVVSADSSGLEEEGPPARRPRSGALVTLFEGAPARASTDRLRKFPNGVHSRAKPSRAFRRRQRPRSCRPGPGSIFRLDSPRPEGLSPQETRSCCARATSRLPRTRGPALLFAFVSGFTRRLRPPPKDRARPSQEQRTGVDRRSDDGAFV